MPADAAFDLVFIGHMCWDEVHPYGGEVRVAAGSAVLCGALAAARVGRRVGVVARLAPQDESMLASMRAAGITTWLAPAAATTYMQVIHPSPDPDVRRLVQTRSAGRFEPADLPPFAAGWVHLAGVSDQEFSLDFVRHLKGLGCRLSADMQSFVRQVDPGSGEIHFRDVPAKEEIAGLMDRLKLDVVEAQILTGTRDLEQAALAIEAWGCPEVVITSAQGVLARAMGRTWFVPFHVRQMLGRTGRGDTTFGAYLARRMDWDVPAALKFAAALVSIKMESPGPFHGTEPDVLARMALMPDPSPNAG